MTTIEMFVSLKVPDNVAITALNTLKRMDYKIKGLERSDYYKFKIKDNESQFKKQISNVDLLVNVNKHKFSFKIDNKGTNVLVQDLDGINLVSTLKGLGFNNIKKAEKGVLWSMHFDKKINASKTAIDITKNLLMNENYQSYKVLK
jgi:phosphoribosylformylglycinamidine (FGAM) synthase PurS component